jgi:hypothetical protein
MKRLKLLLTGFLFLMLLGCTKETLPVNCPSGTSGMSFSNDIQPIFDQNCAACHVGNVAPDLSPGWAYDELTDGGYVDDPSGAPCETALYQVFQGTHSGRASEEDVLKILGWIQDGANDN